VAQADQAELISRIPYQAAIPRLLDRGGRIVTVGARGGVAGGAGTAAYAAAKAGVMRLTESLSEELKDKGITVNCVMPSIIDTPQNRAAMPTPRDGFRRRTSRLSFCFCFRARRAPSPAP
jgi:NAD(P)-dependent dehydrogenase (short-subunit alcohol dehydrogenase family)